MKLNLNYFNYLNLTRLYDLPSDTFKQYVKKLRNNRKVKTTLITYNKLAFNNGIAVGVLSITAIHILINVITMLLS